MRWDSKYYCVYILTNFTKTVLYTGVTNNLQQRITEHYIDSFNPSSFAGKYKAFYLLYYEVYDYVNNAIAREKEIKGWRREKKLDLIKTLNKELQFLNVELFGVWPPENIHHRKNNK